MGGGLWGVIFFFQNESNNTLLWCQRIVSSSRLGKYEICTKKCSALKVKFWFFFCKMFFSVWFLLVRQNDGNNSSSDNNNIDNSSINNRNNNIGSLERQKMKYFFRTIGLKSCRPETIVKQFRGNSLKQLIKIKLTKLC